MSYNPDEFVRLKHFNEFTRQLNIKLDGVTDPTKPARTVSFGQFNRKSTSSNAVDADILTSKLSRTGVRTQQEGFAYHFTIRITEVFTPTKTPIVFNGSESFVDVLKFCWNGQGVSSEWGAWDIYLLTSSNEPHVDTFSITLPAEPDFTATTFNFTVHFISDT